MPIEIAAIAKCRNASHVLPHVVLTDLDSARCAVELIRNRQTLNLPARMMFRVAVREIEWLAAELSPPAGSPVSIGPLYNERLCAFVRNCWTPDSARSCAPSLARMIDRLGTFLR